MKKSKLRGLIIAVILVVTFYYFLPLVIDNLPSFWTSKRLKLGLDLQGGSQIQLEVDFTDLELSEKEKEDAVKTALQIIRNRIDQFGVAEPSIQRVGTSNRIAIQLPGLKDPSRAKELIGKTALLEFKLLAENEQIQEVIDNLNAYLDENIDKYEYLQKFVDVETEEVADVLESEEDDTEAEEESNEIFTKLITSEDGYPNIIEHENLAAFKTLLKDPGFADQIPAGIQLAVGKENKNDPYTPRALYYLLAKAELTGKYLENASVKIGQGYDPKTSGKPYIALTFNKSGAKKFANVTGENINKRLAIVLDNVVYVAPTIQDRIPSGEARITGSFTIEESNDLVIVLNAGNLPAPVNIIEERTVGPTLGSDSIKAGVMAALIGMIFVVIFMIIYYGFSGLIADLAVIINLGFIIAVLTMLEGTLTMPGIAGIILTIGMSVDANVIIFERIRENIEQGKTPRTAVDGGFSRALVTILDANITTLITALVLYQFGTGPIKGFAVTLSIGIVGSMFASIVLVKAIFDGFVVNTNKEKLSI